MAETHVVGEAPEVYPDLAAAREAKVEADARLAAALKKEVTDDEPTDVPASDQG